MPSKEEQFVDWYDNADRADLVEALDPKIKEKIEEAFRMSQTYEDALYEYTADKCEEQYQEEEHYREEVWFDEANLEGDNEEEGDDNDTD